MFDLTPYQLDLIRTFFSGMCCFVSLGSVGAFVALMAKAGKEAAKTNWK